MSFRKHIFCTNKADKNTLYGQRCWLFAKVTLSVSLTVMLVASFNLPVRADDALALSLVKLENKFFQHDYSKDNNDERVARLEKMVFGETKTGGVDERVKALMAAVPNLDSVESAQSSKPTGSPEGSKPSGQVETAKSAVDEVAPVNSSKYPAVTAIETKLFGKDYADEPVTKRLDRLETKVFGKVSDVQDLSERVDRIKEQTGVDITKQVPAGSDWVDDDQDQMPLTGREPILGDRQSGTDDVDDLNQGGNFQSGRYGFKQQESYLPPSMPPFNGNRFAPQLGTSPNMQGMGLSQQVSALELEIFGKVSGHEPLTARVGRLETSVFPNEKPDADKSLPERVNRLLSAVPISNKNKIVHSGKQKKNNDGFDDLNSLDPDSLMSSQNRSGLSRLFGFFTGAGAGMNGIPAGGLVRDPSTGLYIDRSTGNLIDPTTGAVVGQRPIPSMMQMGGMNPYGSGLGFGGTGIHFGFGGGGVGGLWP